MTTQTQDPNEVAPAVADLDTIVSLSKRRGFIYPSSEIYGGINAVWDYGPLGVELKNNVKRAWWRAMVQERDDIVALDAAILMHPRVWEASGHLEGFTDPLVQCLGKCKRRWREDHLREAVEAEGGDPSAELRCPECGGELSEPRAGMCVRMAKLNFHQCLASAGPYYEDLYCLGRHAMLETSSCVSQAASGAKLASR